MIVKFESILLTLPVIVTECDPEHGLIEWHIEGFDEWHKKEQPLAYYLARAHMRNLEQYYDGIDNLDHFILEQYEAHCHEQFKSWH